jgi:hypothetical protein
MIKQINMVAMISDRTMLKSNVYLTSKITQSLYLSVHQEATVFFYSDNVSRESKRNTEALLVVLKLAPINTKSKETKDNAFQVVLNVLRSFTSSNDIDNAIKQLDMDAIDVLMKYLYKGFELEPRYSSVFLNWHEKVHIISDIMFKSIVLFFVFLQAYSVGGSGSIIRVLSGNYY